MLFGATQEAILDDLVQAWVHGWNKLADEEQSIDQPLVGLESSLSDLYRELDNLSPQKKAITALMASVVVGGLVQRFTDAVVREDAFGTDHCLAQAAWLRALHDNSQAYLRLPNGEVDLGYQPDEIRLEPDVSIGPIMLDLVATFVDHVPPGQVTRVAVLVYPRTKVQDELYNTISSMLKNQGYEVVLLDKREVTRDPFGAANKLFDVGFQRNPPDDDNVVPLTPPKGPR